MPIMSDKEYNDYFKVKQPKKVIAEPVDIAKAKEAVKDVIRINVKSFWENKFNEPDIKAACEMYGVNFKEPTSAQKESIARFVVEVMR